MASDKVVISLAGPSGQVMEWPEFQAFAKRLGIADKGETRRIEIILDVRETPVIRHEFIANWDS